MQSFEHHDAIAEIAKLCRDERWTLSTWDIDRGLTLDGRAAGDATTPTTDPLAAIRSLDSVASPEGTVLMVLKNFHRFLGSVEIVQALDAQIHAGKQNRTFVVILAPMVQIPLEFEKLFVVVDHDLPDRGQIEAIARSLATEAGELPEGLELDAVLEIPLIDAASQIVPVAVTARESIERLRSWAAGRCLAADRPGLYNGPGTPDNPSRKLRRGKPSDN